MLITEGTLAYLSEIHNRIANGTAIERKPDEEGESDADKPLDYCVECEGVVSLSADRDHVVLERGDEVIVAVCCEGFWPLAV